MDDARLVRVSKYLSKHLRHQPERLGLALGPGGWVDVEALLAACARHQFPITRAELDEVVARNDKQRFAIDPTGTRIRANQGHSVDVDLELEPATPPAVLYHGTHPGALDAIRAEGLSPMRRRHVHLSADVPAARQVGARRGRAVVLEIDAAALHRDGHPFFLADNGVWLTDAVPPAMIRGWPTPS